MTLNLGQPFAFRMFIVTSSLVLIIFSIELKKKIHFILEHDRGQTDSQAQSQRLSAAHHKVTFDPDWIQIFNRKGKQRLPV